MCVFGAIFGMDFKISNSLQVPTQNLEVEYINCKSVRLRSLNY